MRVLLTTLSLFILSGCYHSDATRSGERDPLPSVISTATPSEATENRQTVTPIEDGGELCEKHLLEQIAEEAKDSQIIKLKVFDTKDDKLAPDLKKWLENMDKDNLVAYELRHNDHRALLLGSTNLGATGIAANFQNWYLNLNNHSVKFLSLSENPNLVFWDKDGLLNYYSVEYGKSFLENRNWDNLTLDLIRHSIDSNGASTIVSEERNVKCQ